MFDRTFWALTALGVPRGLPQPQMYATAYYQRQRAAMAQPQSRWWGGGSSRLKWVVLGWLVFVFGLTMMPSRERRSLVRTGKLVFGDLNRRVGLAGAGARRRRRRDDEPNLRSGAGNVDMGPAGSGDEDEDADYDYDYQDNEVEDYIDGDAEVVEDVGDADIGAVLNRKPRRRRARSRRRRRKGRKAADSGGEQQNMDVETEQIDSQPAADGASQQQPQQQQQQILTPPDGPTTKLDLSQQHQQQSKPEAAVVGQTPPEEANSAGHSHDHDHETKPAPASAPASSAVSDTQSAQLPPASSNAASSSSLKLDANGWPIYEQSPPRDPSWALLQRPLPSSNERSFTSHKFKEAMPHSMNPPQSRSSLPLHVQAELSSRLVIALGQGVHSGQLDVAGKGLNELPIFNTMVRTFLPTAQPNHVYRCVSN